MPAECEELKVRTKRQDQYWKVEKTWRKNWIAKMKVLSQLQDINYMTTKQIKKQEKNEINIYISNYCGLHTFIDKICINNKEQVHSPVRKSNIY